jgi:hypothetical protein
MSRQSVSVLCDEGFQAWPFFVSFLNINANQNYSTGRLFQTIDELPEIFVLRQQDAPFNKGILQNFPIRGACLSFKHINDIVTVCPEAGNDAGIATLIGKNSLFYRLSESNLFIGKIIGGKCLGVIYIFAGQMGVIFDNFLDSHAA